MPFGIIFAISYFYTARHYLNDAPPGGELFTMFIEEKAISAGHETASMSRDTSRRTHLTAHSFQNNCPGRKRHLKLPRYFHQSKAACPSAPTVKTHLFQTSIPIFLSRYDRCLKGLINPNASIDPGNFLQANKNHAVLWLPKGAQAAMAR